MVKLYSTVAGKLENSKAREKFLVKLKRKGAKITKKVEKSDAFIVFCPIASRYETDVKAALASLPALVGNVEGRKVVVVAMHHTFDPNYTLPSCRQMETEADVIVDCLFYEKKGLLKCESNKRAVKTICKELKIMTHFKKLMKSRSKTSNNVRRKK